MAPRLPLPLGALKGRTVGSRALHLLDVRRGRFPEEKRFRMGLRGAPDPVLEGIAFEGRTPIRRWMEFRYDPAPLRAGEPGALFRLLGRAVGPGGHLSVKYESPEHRTTARALAAGVPPPATPLGFLLWAGGARWFKDWYFSEGWLEGEQKLQGNVPLDATHKKQREKEARAELIAFLNRIDTFESSLKLPNLLRAKNLLAGMETPRSHSTRRK